MRSSNQHQPALRRLDRFELREASMWVAKKWFEQFVRSADGAEGSTELAEFGAFEPNLAEAIVLDHGSDFVFPKWGAALNTLCGGDHRGHRLSVLPQPSRGQLRRVCVRATVAQAPAADEATWIVDGQIWRCAMLAMPTAGDELAATRLLVAVLFVPHPIFAAQVVPDDASHATRLDCRERLADSAEREPHVSFHRGQPAGSDNADERVELGHAIQHASPRAYRSRLVRRGGLGLRLKSAERCREYANRYRGKGV
jgi:hypothetical protein